MANALLYPYRLLSSLWQAILGFGATLLAIIVSYLATILIAAFVSDPSPAVPWGWALATMAIGCILAIVYTNKHSNKSLFAIYSCFGALIYMICGLCFKKLYLLASGLEAIPAELILPKIALIVGTGIVGGLVSCLLVEGELLQ